MANSAELHHTEGERIGTRTEGGRELARGYKMKNYVEALLGLNILALPFTLLWLFYCINGTFPWFSLLYWLLAANIVPILGGLWVFMVLGVRITGGKYTGGRR